MTPSQIASDGSAPGTALDSGLKWTGVIFSLQRGLEALTPPASAPPDSATAVTAISSLSNYAASYYSPNLGQAATSHAFAILNGTFLDLGGLLPQSASSRANSINAHGQITGWYRDAATGAAKPFLYSGNMIADISALVSPTDLNGFYITALGQINDNGWITAYGKRSGTNEFHAFLLIPTPNLCSYITCP